MALSGLQQLKDELKNHTPGKFYIFTGEEAYLRSHYLGLLRKQLLDKLTEEFNYHHFTEENFTLQALTQSLEALPMMAERTLIQVEDVNLFACNENEREQLAKLLTDIPDYCTLVLTYETMPYKPDNRMKKLAQALSGALLVDFKRQNERELCDWIARHCNAGGKQISEELCRYLIALTGGSMSLLQSELHKLTAFVQGKQITKAEIDAIVDPVPDAVAFDLSDAIAGGNYALAMTKLQTLLQMQQEPLAILGAIAAQMRRILTAKALLRQTNPSEELASLCGIPSYPARKTVEFARKLPQRFCRRAALLCLEADSSLKSSADSPQRTLELLVLRLSQEAKND